MVVVPVSDSSPLEDRAPFRWRIDSRVAWQLSGAEVVALPASIVRGEIHSMQNTIVYDRRPQSGL
jgi:hypothetical protein